MRSVKIKPYVNSYFNDSLLGRSRFKGLRRDSKRFVIMEKSCYFLVIFIFIALKFKIPTNALVLLMKAIKKRQQTTNLMIIKHCLKRL